MAIDLVTGSQYGISGWNIPARLPIIGDADQLGLKQPCHLGGLSVESEATAHVVSLRELPGSPEGHYGLTLNVRPVIGNVSVPLV